MPQINDCEIIHSFLIDGRCRYCEQHVRAGAVVVASDSGPSLPAQWDVERLCATAPEAEWDCCVMMAVTSDCDVLQVLPYFEMLLESKASLQTLDAVHDLPHVAGDLSTDDASRCTRLLLDRPDSLALRVLLLGYYFGAAHEEGGSVEHAQLIHWFIESRPKHSIHATAYCMIPWRGPAFEQGCAAWNARIESEPNDTTILGNAARFHMIFDPAKSEELLLRASSLEPDRRIWVKRLSELYLLEAHANQGEAKRAAAAKSMEYGERALRMGPDPVEELVLDTARQEGEENAEAKMDQMRRFSELPQLAKMAFEAGQLEWARNYANEILELERLSPEFLNHGDHVHTSVTILGRLALRSGEIETAKAFLSRSFETELNSFGPDFSLAKELLDQGEREAVVSFLESCCRKWSDGEHIVDPWIREIKEGRTPEIRGMR